MEMSYSLQLVDVSDVSFLEKEIDIKVALIHNQSGGIGGRDIDTPFEVRASYRNTPEKRLVRFLLELWGLTEIYCRIIKLLVAKLSLVRVSPL